MEKDDSGSIFDRASDLSKKRRLLQKKKKKPEPALPAQKFQSMIEAEPKGNPEVTSMFTRMREMQEDLEAKMLELYSKIGVSRTIAEEFFNDPKNMASRKKEEIDNQIIKLEEQMTKILGVRAKQVAKQFKTTKESEKRTQKFIGQRRKWLKM